MLSNLANYVRNKWSEMSLTSFLQGRVMMQVGKWSQTSCSPCSHSGAFMFAQVSTACVELYLTSFPSQWPRTLGAVFQISHHQSPRSRPHSSHFRIEMFCLPNSVPYPQSAAFPRFLVFSQSFAAKAKRQVLAAPAGSLQPDAKRQAK